MIAYKTIDPYYGWFVAEIEVNLRDTLRHIESLEAGSVAGLTGYGPDDGPRRVVLVRDGLLVMPDEGADRALTEMPVAVGNPGSLVYGFAEPIGDVGICKIAALWAPTQANAVMVGCPVSFSGFLTESRVLAANTPDDARHRALGALAGQCEHVAVYPVQYGYVENVAR